MDVKEGIDTLVHEYRTNDEQEFVNAMFVVMMQRGAAETACNICALMREISELREQLDAMKALY